MLHEHTQYNIILRYTAPQYCCDVLTLEESIYMQLYSHLTPRRWIINRSMIIKYVTRNT